MAGLPVAYSRRILHRYFPCVIGIILISCILRETQKIVQHVDEKETSTQGDQETVSMDRGTESRLRESLLMLNKGIRSVVTDSVNSANETFGLTTTKSAIPAARKRFTCLEYAREMKRNHTVYVNVFENKNTDSDKVCLITQLTHSRFHMLQRVTDYWQGPISAAIYVNPSGLNQSKEEVKKWLNSNNRSNVAIHYMLENGTFYPVNELRNVAQDNTRAEYVFLIDVDFIPNRILESTINSYIDQGFFNSDKEKALIVPALELMKTNISFPETKHALIELAKQHRIEMFHKHVRKAHSPTMFRNWVYSTKTYQVLFVEGFEPYVVLKRELSPRYDQRFIQRYFNKVSHLYALNHMGVQFWVMPEGYLVHIPHSYDYKKSDKIFKCALAVWNKFKFEMKYGEKIQERPSRSRTHFASSLIRRFVHARS